MTLSDEKNQFNLVRFSEKMLELMKMRRSVRSFSLRAIPRQAIENCIAIAATAPSGANLQPWSFQLVESKELKKRIREEAEGVERIFYSRRLSEEWKNRLAPLGTDHRKGFLEEAPYLIVVFRQRYGLDKGGGKVSHYFVKESVGIAVGLLISALHQLGISSLPYTPIPMTFLSTLLNRPKNERPFLLLAVGYPRENYEPPQQPKKTAEQFLTIH
jgi:nitroreductase